MTHKTISDWSWGRGSDPVDEDIPDWCINALLWIIGLAATAGAIYLLVKAPKPKIQKDVKPKTENVIQMQEIINNDTAYIIIYRNTYVR